MKCILLASIFFLFNLTACTNTPQADELTIIQSMSIDKINDEFLISIQSYDTASSDGKATPQGSSKNIITTDGKGNSIENALVEIETSLGKDLFVGHCSMVIIGRETIENSSDIILDFLSKNNDYNLNMQIMVSNGIAKDLVSFDNGTEKFSPSSAEDIYEKSVDIGETVETSLQKLLVSREIITEKGVSLSFPLIFIEESGQIYYNGKLVLINV